MDIGQFKSWTAGTPEEIAVHEKAALNTVLEALKLAGLGDEQCKGIGEMVLEWGALHAAKHVKIALNKIKDGLP
jgi:hypothetical protein